MSNGNPDHISPFETPEEKYYEAELLEVPEPARKLLEGYSKIPSDLILPHVLDVREKAWSNLPSKCVGHFRFLDLGLAQNPAYNEILERVKKGHQFLDVACVAGQDLRQLVADGAPSENLYATDRLPQFFQIGYDLFKDRETLNSLFLAADLFAKESVLSQLAGKIDIIWTNNSLHIFPWDKQVEIIKILMKLLKPSPHSLIVGRMRGSREPKAYEDSGYWHDVKSFKKMFHTAGDALNEKWQTDVTTQPWEPSVKLKGVESNAGVDALELTFRATKLERLDAAASHRFVF